jgi:anthranilate phosphoribosyltransferase
MLKSAIEKLITRQNLSQKESSLAMHDMLSEADPHQIAAFLALMRAKGETVEELHGITEAMRTLMVSVSIDYPVLDIVGTGGDGAHTLNISTASAILAASCGVKIAKHGNRSVSSQSGSADVLEALGVPIRQTSDQIKCCIDQLNIGFLFAPDFHPALKHIKDIRKGLNIRTLFNIIAPLLNPARAEHLMLGVFSEELLDIVASLLFRLGTQQSFVFHGKGLDELSCLGPAKVLEVSEQGIRSFVLDPLAFGLKRCSLQDLRGKDAHYNAEQILQTFSGQEGAFADTIILNAGVALYLYGLVPNIQAGIEQARLQLKNEQALKLLHQWRAHG